MTSQNAIADALLAWWDEGHSPWPWRNSRDPYAVWVAEVMLQQTQVATVLPYYKRWMARFPTVQSLASASQDDVLKVWEGLGYYSRARNLRAAALVITNDFGGQMPKSAESLRKLPGIGRYTAGAVASIAFGERTPAVEANAIRVISRLFDIDEDVGRAKTKNKIWKLADELLSADRPGDFNQALMELGQKACLPSSPDCQACPLILCCQAFARGTLLQRPVKTKKPITPHYQVVAGIICRGDGHFLITKRPADGLLGGMWEFPGGKQRDGEDLGAALRREITEELGIDIAVRHKLGAINHAYSHFKITLHVFLAQLSAGVPQNLEVADHAWVELGELVNYPMSSADRKVVVILGEEAQWSINPPCKKQPSSLNQYP